MWYTYIHLCAKTNLDSINFERTIIKKLEKDNFAPFEIKVDYEEEGERKLILGFNLPDASNEFEAKLLMYDIIGKLETIDILKNNTTIDSTSHVSQVSES